MSTSFRRDCFGLKRFLRQHVPGISEESVKKTGSVLQNAADVFRNGNVELTAQDGATEPFGPALAMALGHDAVAIKTVPFDMLTSRLHPRQFEMIFDAAAAESFQSPLAHRHHDLLFRVEMGEKGTDRLSSVIEIGLGRHIPFEALGKPTRLGYPLADAVLKNVAFCLKLHLGYVLLGDEAGAARTKPLADCLARGLPLCVGNLGQLSMERDDDDIDPNATYWYWAANRMVTSSPLP